MVELRDILLFGFAALMMVLSPGPNMVYLVSRSLCQGKRPATVSLFGVATGFAFHMLLAAFGLSAVLMAVPIAYTALKLTGALYLGWLAWQAIRPNSPSLFETRSMQPDSNAKLFSMGLLTNALNPKIAVFYLSIFTQFLHLGARPSRLASVGPGCDADRDQLHRQPGHHPDRGRSEQLVFHPSAVDPLAKMGHGRRPGRAGAEARQQSAPLKAPRRSSGKRPGLIVSS